MPDVIRAIRAEVARRADAPVANRPIYLIISGLQRARDLRRDEGMGMISRPPLPPFGQAPAERPLPNPNVLFPTILRDGPDVDVHTIAWCDTLANLQRTFDQRTWREFDMRVVFQMAAQDSTTLIDTPLASSLGPNRAYFYSEEKGMLEKFRPYQAPSDEWLASVARRITVCPDAEKADNAAVLDVAGA